MAVVQTPDGLRVGYWGQGAYRHPVGGRGLPPHGATI
jgi:hypothetical protein